MDSFAIRIHLAAGNRVLNRQFNVIRPRHFAKTFQRVLQQFFGANPLDAEPLLARFDAGQRQQVFVSRDMRAAFLRMISRNSRT